MHCFINARMCRRLFKAVSYQVEGLTKTWLALLLHPGFISRIISGELKETTVSTWVTLEAYVARRHCEETAEVIDRPLRQNYSRGRKRAARRKTNDPYTTKKWVCLFFSFSPWAACLWTMDRICFQSRWRIVFMHSQELLSRLSYEIRRRS